MHCTVPGCSGGRSASHAITKIYGATCGPLCSCRLYDSSYKICTSDLSDLHYQLPSETYKRRVQFRKFRKHAESTRCASNCCPVDSSYFQMSLLVEINTSTPSPLFDIFNVISRKNATKLNLRLVHLATI